MIPTSLVLTGMMGTGKTTVGRLLADRTQRRFVDLDQSIEQSTGRSVSDIFDEAGEPGFRLAERRAVQDLARQLRSGTPSGGAIIATGGFTIADAESRTALESVGPIVCLTSTVEALRDRLEASGGQSRPLLEGPTGLGADLERLATERRHIYDSVPLQVDTTSRTPRSVADSTLELVDRTHDLETSAIPVDTGSGGYAVVVAPGLLEPLGTILTARLHFGRACIVTDPIVGDLFGRRLAASLQLAGAQSTVVTIESSEASKSLATVETLYREFLGVGLERTDLVVALGGGIVGDTAGFAAATYMRGVRTVIVPTTLLAMVDSSIGGKTSVNLPEGKNLVGSFKHPEMVAVDPSLLVSLPNEILRAGLAEVVKAGVIADVGLLELLEVDGAQPATDVQWWSAIVRSAATVKALVVSDDPDERGQRVALNLGHTFAHALESASSHSIEHGHAVAIGLVAAARLSARLGIADHTIGDRIEHLLTALDLPIRFSGPSARDVVDAMTADKKRSGGDQRFVLPICPGEVRVVDRVPASDVLAVVSELRER